MFCWYAVYTSPRTEKKVRERLEAANIENYLPLKTEFRVWSDRKKKISVPLIPGYVFVRIGEKDFLTVLNIPGIVAFLKEGGKAVPIPDKQLKDLKLVENNYEGPIEISVEEIAKGSWVKVVRGRLSGLEGELLEFQGAYRVILRLNYLGCALLTIPMSCIEKVKVV